MAEVTLLAYKRPKHQLMNHNSILISSVTGGGNKRLSMSLSAAWLICCSLAILNALQEIPHNEMHETLGFKNDGWIHIEKYLT